MKHIETSIPGLILCVLGLALCLFGKRDPVQDYLIGGGLIAAGIGLLRASDQNKTVQKADLPDLGLAGRMLDRAVKANEQDAKEEKPN
jgi:hypothetical protein